MDKKEEKKILNKKAVALEYNEKAKIDGIDMYFDEELLENLMALSIGDEIPQELYEIVSKVLQYIDSLEKNIKSDK